MVVGDFNGDGQDQVCYLRRRLFFLYPLGVLCTVDGQAGFRILPLYSYPRPSSALFAAELGPRQWYVVLSPGRCYGLAIDRT